MSNSLEFRSLFFPQGRPLDKENHRGTNSVASKLTLVSTFPSSPKAVKGPSTSTLEPGYVGTNTPKRYNRSPLKQSLAPRSDSRSAASIQPSSLQMCYVGDNAASTSMLDRYHLSKMSSRGMMDGQDDVDTLTSQPLGDNMDQSYSSDSEESLDTTSSSLEEHLMELMDAANQEQRCSQPRSRDCQNPVGWTLLHSDAEIVEDCSFLQRLDRAQCSQGSPSFVRTSPPVHATRPRAQLPSSSYVPMSFLDRL